MYFPISLAPLIPGFKEIKPNFIYQSTKRNKMHWCLYGNRISQKDQSNGFGGDRKSVEPMVFFCHIRNALCLSFLSVRWIPSELGLLRKGIWETSDVDGGLLTFIFSSCWRKKVLNYMWLNEKVKEDNMIWDLKKASIEPLYALYWTPYWKEMRGFVRTVRECDNGTLLSFVCSY